MARKAETVFSSRVHEDLKYLERRGFLWFTKVQQVGIRGTPDYIANAYGSFVAIELKREYGLPPDALQKYNLNKIESTLGHAFLACPETWDSMLEKITKLCISNRRKAK